MNQRKLNLTHEELAKDTEILNDFQGSTTEERRGTVPGLSQIFPYL